jgi:DNA-binding GntR family transcriptional regulator
MLTTVEGLYRNGVVELSEIPSRISENTRVIVTFLENGTVDLAASGIDQQQAAELRARLRTFAEDWESEEMSVYDDYDAAKSRL